MKKGVPYKRWRWLAAFTDALFILGVVVFTQDTIWLAFNTWKWWPQYGQAMTWTGYFIRFPQNLVGLCFLALLSFGLWKAGYVRILRAKYWLLAIAGFTGLVFLLAPNPGWTDYTYAVRMGAPGLQVLGAFLISHVGYKSLIAMAFLSLFKERKTAKLGSDPAVLGDGLALFYLEFAASQKEPFCCCINHLQAQKVQDQGDGDD